jgi:hypothetical protein
VCKENFVERTRPHDDIPRVNRLVVACLVVAAGCAKGTSNGFGDAQGGFQDAAYDDAPGRGIIADSSVPADVKLPPDAKIFHDAKEFEDAKDFEDAKVFRDAPPPIDAKIFMDACIESQMQLLANPTFDLMPVATGWTETENPNKMVEIVTNQPPSENGFSPQSPAYYAWMGGFVSSSHSTTYTDEMQQNITIPAGSTALTLTGYYIVNSAEEPDFPYDNATLGLTQLDGTQITPQLALDNTMDDGTQSYHGFSLNYTNAASLAGTSVTMRITTTNDYSNATNFIFDTLALTATYCP